MKDRACIFIDGENLRHSIKGLFPSDYKNSHYLPVADWQYFISVITQLTSKKISGSELNLIKLVRCYWYVISELSYDRWFKERSFDSLPVDERLKYLQRMCRSSFEKELKNRNKLLKDLTPEEQGKLVEFLKTELSKRATKLDARFSEWMNVQSSIQHSTARLQFQRFGFLKVHLDGKGGAPDFVGEKGVDVKLATDLISLKDIYDIAIIISGDADYIPAITQVKNMGKTVVVVDFKSQDGKFLPGGSRKLKEHADDSFSIDYNSMRAICRYDVKAGEPTTAIDIDSIVIAD